MYLLDANVCISANATFFGLDQVPEFWDWLIHLGNAGTIKIPLEIFEEIEAGTDLVAKWLKSPEVKTALKLDAPAEPALVRRAIAAYGSPLSDTDLVKLGRDPFLVAHALASSPPHTVVTAEVSRPSKIGANRKVPDICDGLGIPWLAPATMNRVLGFSTGWNKGP